MDDPEHDVEDDPSGSVAGRWEQVLADMEATVGDYEAGGWTAVELHPGDVTVLGDGSDDPGLDVLVPDDEFEALRDAVAGCTFDSYEVLRATDEGVVFLLVVLEDAAGDVAVFVPAYYERSDIPDLRDAVTDGALTTYVRRLSGEERVEFDHEDPAPFFPDEDGDEADE